jgi:hypothetical protein
MIAAPWDSCRASRWPRAAACALCPRRRPNPRRWPTRRRRDNRHRGRTERANAVTALGELGVTITSNYIGPHGSDTRAAHLVVTRERRALEQAELRATLSRSPTRAVPARPRTGGARGPHRRHGRNRHCQRRAHARPPVQPDALTSGLEGPQSAGRPYPRPALPPPKAPPCSLGLRVGPYSRSPTASRAWSGS